MALSSRRSLSARPSGPSLKASFSVCSMSAPPMTASNGLISSGPKPPLVSKARTRLASANANGPGAVGSGASTGCRNGNAAWSGTSIQGFSLRARQQTKTSRPPGFSDLRMLANAVPGSLKNITPKRENAASNRLWPRSFAPPVMVLLMLLVRKERVMGKLIVEGWLYWIGWIATTAMALSIVGMAVSIAIG
jgi:hypothetical protein